MTDLRPIKLFLSDEGVYTVSTTVPSSKSLICDCDFQPTKRNKHCAHILWVRADMVGDMLPVDFNKKIKPEELQKLVDGPLDEYRKFFSRHAKIEVI